MEKSDRFVRYSLSFLLFFLVGFGLAQKMPLSSETEECIGCHEVIQPGLVQSWRDGRHSKITPQAAFKKEKIKRRISSQPTNPALQKVVVGCYECHALNADQHPDTFEHNGYKIHTVVSSKDCATCHAEEAGQYGHNIMAHAYGNLVDNTVYQQLIKSVIRPASQTDHAGSDFLTMDESCLYCHGTKVTVKGMETRDTEFGEMKFPVLTGWPNQGVGRLNPDGSLGSCTSCHPRHDFSIETARQPYTCSECHKGPDVPAYKVYSVSKHGNIFKSQGKKFNLTAVPWKIGQDFTAPTCATCHASLLTDSEGNVIAERTHQFNDRLAWRLLGVPYAVPHPRTPELYKIRNSAGLPLTADLDGSPASKFLITKEEQKRRNDRMQKICLTCHSSGWVKRHFKRLDNTIQSTNALTLSATKIMSKIWEKGLADQGNMFDEEPERLWTSLWLFYNNSTRFASAMAGGGDYGVFANGRYQGTEQLFRLKSWLELHIQMAKKAQKK